MLIKHYAFYDLHNIDPKFFSYLFPNDIKTIRKLCNNIDVLSKRHKEFGYEAYMFHDEHGQASNELAELKFKGDIFEIFAECYFKLNGTNPEVGITNYINAKKDAPGVDAFGKGQQHGNIAIQIKFRSDEMQTIGFEDIAKFMAFAYQDYDVKVGAKNLVLFTTCKGMVPMAEKTFHDIRTINIDKIAKHIDNLDSFWLALNDLIANSIAKKGETILLIKSDSKRLEYVNKSIAELKEEPLIGDPLRFQTVNIYKNAIIDGYEDSILVEKKLIENYSQRRCFERMQTDDILSICHPTGTGKGFLLFVDLLNRISHKNGKVFAICSHRILLNKQHTDDMFNKFKYFIGEIGYIFVASEQYDNDKFSDPEIPNNYNTEFANLGIKGSDLIQTAKNKAQLKLFTEQHLDKGRQVIIITTYNSLARLEDVELDVIYCDEAHKLASDKSTPKEESFMDNYKKIKSKKRFFFTATPKDWTQAWYSEEHVHLMNNKAIFGERIIMEFEAATKLGYILKPYIHVVSPVNLHPELSVTEIESSIVDEEDFDCDVNCDSSLIDVKNLAINVPAKILLIIQSFIEHKKFLKDRSAEPDKIGPKLLVKCKNISVDMWGIFHDGLKDALKDAGMSNVKVFAGASEGYKSSENIDFRNNNLYINDMPISDRDTYLNALGNLKSEEESIVLHCDILSEGINVSGFTAVMFISGVASTDSKVLQNIGRATRLHPIDRARLSNGEISVSDMSKWIKPFCSVIIPFWDSESEEAKEILKGIIDRLTQLGFELEGKSLGTDISTDDNQTDEEEPVNFLTSIKKRSKIHELIHELQELDHLRKLNSLDPLAFVYEINDINIGNDIEDVDKLFNENMDNVID